MGGDARIAVTAVCASLCLLGLLRIAYAWISPPEKPGLRFSEAEIAFLFPAPVTRRALIHYRLVSAQIAILFTGVLMAFIFNRFGYLGGHRALRAIGWWVILSTYDLHLNGTNLTLGSLRERSRHFLLWRLGAVTAIALYVAAVLSGRGRTGGGAPAGRAQCSRLPSASWTGSPVRPPSTGYRSRSASSSAPTPHPGRASSRSRWCRPSCSWPSTTTGSPAPRPGSRRARSRSRKDGRRSGPRRSAGRSPGWARRSAGRVPARSPWRHRVRRSSRSCGRT